MRIVCVNFSVQMDLELLFCFVINIVQKETSYRKLKFVKTKKLWMDMTWKFMTWKFRRASYTYQWFFQQAEDSGVEWNLVHLFELFFDDTLFDLIVNETNVYARYKNQTPEQFRDTAVEEKSSASLVFCLCLVTTNFHPTESRGKKRRMFRTFWLPIMLWERVVSWNSWDLFTLLLCHACPKTHLKWLY